MEPLSVSASIIGILTAVSKVVEIVQPYVSTVAHAPQIAVSVFGEVNRVRIVLSSLRLILENVHTRPGRAAFIQVDQLIVMFTDGVLIFAELEGLLEPLRVKKGAEGAVNVVNLWEQGDGIEGWRLDGAARVLWARKKGDIDQVLGRLQRFLVSLTAMLNIFQCGSDVAATRSQEELETQVEKLLDSNQDLAARVRDLEDAFNANGALVRRLGSVIQRGDDEEEGEDAETTTITDNQATELVLNRFSSASATDLTFSFVFESDLKTSRVYRRAANNRDSLISFSSSAIGSRAWSVFSGLSLADLSIISVIALPLYPSDIGNSEHYGFGNRDTNMPILLDNATPDRVNSEDKPEVIPLARNSKKGMLSRALTKANTAVLFDKAQNFEGAIKAYGESCTLLTRIMLRSQAEDQMRLEEIRRIYTNRITELKYLVEGKTKVTESIG